MGYPLRPKNLKKSGLSDDNVAAIRDLQRRVSALTEGQPNTNGVGALTWDGDRGTYNIAGTGETSFKIGEDLVYYAKNTSGSTIPIGSSVMFTGAVGASGLLTFGLAVADGSVDPDYMMGITQQEIPNNGFGYIKHFGLLRGFRTDGVPQGETWSDGDLLYFDAATPGGLTKVKPTSPAIHEPIAVVVTASSGNSGSIFVRMKVSESLARLRDVYVNGSLTNGDVLIYDVTQERFEANTLTAGANISITNGPGTITIGSTSTATVSSVALSAPTGFTVSGSPITTSGTLALAFAAGYSLPTTASQTNWDTAYGWGDHAAAGYLTSEADPVFVASPAYGITNTQISNWDTAYGWGDHAVAGYLTSYTETDPTVPAHVKSITTGDISNWNTAYGWGDHAAAGYLTSYTETDPVFVASPANGITGTQITNWDTAYSWGDHALAGYLTSETYTGTVTSVGGTGSVNGITLSGTVTTSGSLTLGGTLSGVSLTSQVTGTLPVGNGGTGATSLTSGYLVKGNGTSAVSASVIYDDGTKAGIGTTSPGYALDVVSSDTSFGYAARIRSNATAANAILQFTDAGATQQNGVLATNDSGFLTIQADGAASVITLRTNSNERARIDSGGKLLVGTTTGTAASVSGKLQAESEIISKGSLAGFFFENRSGGVTSGSNWFGWYNSGGTTYFYNPAVGNIASINSATGAYTALSDEAKKKDFESSDIGLDAILALQPKLFRMATDEADRPKQLGFIAQEVKDHIPQAYVEETSQDVSGEDATYIGINDRPIIAALVKAVQELSARITELEETQT